VARGTLEHGVVENAITAALRAPSAHNAQPWRLSRLEGDAYLLWYAFADKLRADPDDRDGLLAVGGFYETLRLAGEGLGLQVALAPSTSRHDAGIGLGTVTFSPFRGEPDPLADAIGKRQCNRHPYARTPIPADLADGLARLGNVLLPPERVAGLVSRASVMSWKDSRFVSDLQEWTRFDDRQPDGMDFACLRLNRFDQLALRLALRLGRLPGWLAWIYAQRDVRLTRSSGAMAVLITASREPQALVECGRRLIRSWTFINSMGFSWQPMSVVIDQPTVRELGRLIDGNDPVAIYRVGYTPNRAAWSKRRSLEDVLVPAPT
jgi:nitroreductase